MGEDKELAQPLTQEPEPDGPKTFEWASDKQKLAIEMMPGSPILLMGGFNSGKTSAAILRALVSLYLSCPCGHTDLRLKLRYSRHLSPYPK